MIKKSWLKTWNYRKYKSHFQLFITTQLKLPNYSMASYVYSNNPAPQNPAWTQHPALPSYTKKMLKSVRVFLKADQTCFQIEEREYIIFSSSRIVRLIDCPIYHWLHDIVDFLIPSGTMPTSALRECCIESAIVSAGKISDRVIDRDYFGYEYCPSFAPVCVKCQM